ncbi:MAG: DUF2917 domain-containing protein [Ramlibacter sp.]
MNAFELMLEPRAIHRISDAAGFHVSCREGSVWITLDDDPRDIVLEAGQCFSSREHRRALIYAFDRARLNLTSLQEPAQAASIQARVQPCVAAVGARAVELAR